MNDINKSNVKHTGLKLGTVAVVYVLIHLPGGPAYAIDGGGGVGLSEGDPSNPYYVSDDEWQRQDHLIENPDKNFFDRGIAALGYILRGQTEDWRANESRNNEN
ncbi:MAG: hypothetical protein K8F25_16345 [Fimbriimonadaceae bacterium]|nr:hypothetical protein [Alphaproteobacteria bacterium]